MELVMSAIHNRRNSTHRSAIPSRQKRLNIPVFIERMFRFVEEESLFDEKRRDPIRIASINLPGKTNKLPK
jgi:hypothetical protein